MHNKCATPKQNPYAGAIGYAMPAGGLLGDVGGGPAPGAQPLMPFATAEREKLNPPGLIAITAEEVSGRAERLFKIVQRVSAVGNRIYGAQPPTPVCETNQKVQSGDADADRLYRAMQYLDTAIESIEGYLPSLEQL